MYFHSMVLDQRDNFILPFTFPALKVVSVDDCQAVGQPWLHEQTLRPDT